MSDRLPIELVLEIFCDAAEIFLVTDHRSAAALAQTCRMVYETIRPILLRQVVMVPGNKVAVEHILWHKESAAFILDLTISLSWDDYRLPRQLWRNLVNLRSLRGFTEYVQAAAVPMPVSARTARTSLVKIQLWNYYHMSFVPPNVTHVGLCAKKIMGRVLNEFVAWVTDTPSLTHFAIDFVSNDAASLLDTLTPESLMNGLRVIFKAGGPRLVEVSIRLAGDIASQDGSWNSFLAAFRDAQIEDAGWINRVRLWRDDRIFKDWGSETDISVSDARVGVDVWSEARPLAELL